MQHLQVEAAAQGHRTDDSCSPPYLVESHQRLWATNAVSRGAKNCLSSAAVQEIDGRGRALAGRCQRKGRRRLSYR